MTKLEKGKMTAEIEDCDKKIEAITGKEVTLFRPPYGDYNSGVIQTTAQTGHYSVQWSVDSLDWKDLSAEKIHERVTGNIHPGAIVLFHNAAKNTPAALPRILKTLTENGYKIVPVSELIYKDNYSIDHTGKQISKSKSDKTLKSN
jgi:peptidoglycan/xylan/chitin deacetylase (PgdA/CDA1 family)